MSRNSFSGAVEEKCDESSVRGGLTATNWNTARTIWCHGRHRSHLKDEDDGEEGEEEEEVEEEVEEVEEVEKEEEEENG